ncbi:hypothetical protein [Streptomyces sp. NPDC053728]|uniref:hypothetical protein n=1 Tax=Streptomyces sp. NPDC053728 TaxID=3155534 RepID=UPI00341B8243
MTAGENLGLAVTGNNNQTIVQGNLLVGPQPAAGPRLAYTLEKISSLRSADALRFEVHPSLSVEDDKRSLSKLPPYVLRADRLDDLLRSEVRAAKDESRLVMVTGSSSGGKTRACWEAIRAELPEWKVLHPLVPDRPRGLLQALEHSAVGPHTVLWLNEAQLYLLGNDQVQRITSALQDLLWDRGRGPVLVLGTMWPDLWDRFWQADVAADELLDGASQLADLAVTVAMPVAFTKDELTSAAHLINSDPRLVMAREQATSGRISQFLAGAPQLWRRYENASPASQAVLHAAMDARRYGYGPLFSPGFLCAAAEGYIDDAAWHALDDNWFGACLDGLLSQHRQLPGPLQRYRPRAGGTGSAEPLYLLADYLHDRSRDLREKVVPPASLWTAAAEYAPTESDVRAMARAAHKHKALSCEPLYIRADATGYSGPLHWFIRQLIGAADYARARHLIEAHCPNHSFLLGELAAALASAGRRREYEEVSQLARSASGDLRGSRRLAHHLVTARLDEEAERQYYWAAEQGDAFAAEWVTLRAARRGSHAEAARVSKQALLKHYSHGPLLALARHHAAAGAVFQAVDLCRTLAECGFANQLVAAAKEQADRRDHAGAQVFYQAAADVSHPAALEWLSHRSEGNGDEELAERLAQDASRAGNSGALHALAHLRMAKGRWADAYRLNQAAAEAGSSLALDWLARHPPQSTCNSPDI